MTTKNLGKCIKEIFDGQKYIVPLYQRNFAWRKEEIERLLQDIYEAFKKDRYCNYYIGSLVVLKRANGDYEVIDGQQRLTTLSLITKILGINNEPRLFYDSRPEVEDFFRAFYKSTDGHCDIDYPQAFYLRNAINYIKEISLDATGEYDIKISDKNNDFIEYFANNVILVRVEIPQDTDVASYFEIMNNRGEQLQKHEILKSLMMSRVDCCKRKEFAQIWDACSQMDIPIQKLFKADNRNNYFGHNYDEFCFDGLNSNGELENYSSEMFSINDILSNNFNEISNNSADEDVVDVDEYKYKSIIDFPNFLMHIFKIYNKDVPLNEKYLLSTYKEIKDNIAPEQFIKTLFFCRTVFDRYIVKTITDNSDNEDGEKWTLKKPKRYEKSWNYIETYGVNKDSNESSKEQTRVVKALSMLQVTFRTRIYKNWLYEILKWFNDKQIFKVDYNEYIKKLDDIILNNYKDISPNSRIDAPVNLTRENSYSKGLRTPHFIFNFIDYLYWVDSSNDLQIIENSKIVKDFNFKYWNSIEHHLAREWADRNNIPRRDNFIDNLGNLCLISRGANSRLSDRDVKEKVETFGGGNMGANRQIMYKMTKDDDQKYSWTEDKIRQHYNELLNLLECRIKILFPANAPL